MLQKRRLGMAGMALSAVLLLGFTDLLPDRISEFSKKVEQVRGRKFSRSVPASELDIFIHNMHTALWVLAATSLIGAGVSLLRPRHVTHPVADALPASDRIAA